MALVDVGASTNEVVVVGGMSRILKVFETRKLIFERDPLNGAILTKPSPWLLPSRPVLSPVTSRISCSLTLPLDGITNLSKHRVERAAEGSEKYAEAGKKRCGFQKATAAASRSKRVSLHVIISRVVLRT